LSLLFDFDFEVLSPLRPMLAFPCRSSLLLERFFMGHKAIYSMPGDAMAAT
jgi:hypothetical protein